MSRKYIRIYLICIFGGLTLTVISLFYASIVIYKSPGSMGPQSTLRPQIDMDWSNLSTDTVEEGMAGDPLMSIACPTSYSTKEVNRGFPAEMYDTTRWMVCSHEDRVIAHVYPLGFVLNWLFYAVLIRAGMVVYKRVRK